jgi:hypothetical protein
VTKLAKERLAIGTLGSAGGIPAGDERFGTLRRHGAQQEAGAYLPASVWTKAESVTLFDDFNYGAK